MPEITPMFVHTKRLSTQLAVCACIQYLATHTQIRFEKDTKIDCLCRPIKVAYSCFLKSNFIDSSILNETYESFNLSTQTQIISNCLLVKVSRVKCNSFDNQRISTHGHASQDAPRTSSPQVSVFVSANKFIGSFSDDLLLIMCN